MDGMILYSGPLSLFARKVEIALAEKQLAFERVLVPFTQTMGYAPRHKAVLKANPKGQVPVLIDGDLTLYDSTIIVEYLEFRLSVVVSRIVHQPRVVELFSIEWCIELNVHIRIFPAHIVNQ